MNKIFNYRKKDKNKEVRKRVKYKKIKIESWKDDRNKSKKE